VKPLGDARPAWKVLRVLGNMLGVAGFNFETSEDVRTEALGDVATLASRLSNATSAVAVQASVQSGLERIADVPIYATDALVRRAAGLQHTADAAPVAVSVSSALWAELGLSSGASVKVTQGGAQATLPAKLDASLAPTAVRVPAGHADTASIGAMFGPLTVEKV
jgi:NADH-quinone oxidoreductase subunit G